MAKPEVLIIEDSPSLALGYAAQLEEAGYAITVAGTLAEAREALRGSSYAAALLDLQLPDGDGLSLLEERDDNSPAFIVITSDGSLSRAIAAMRVGAFDFLVKPVAGTRLLATTRAAVDQAKVSGAKKDRTKTSDKTSFHGFIGQSPVMKQVYRTIEQVADSRASVFVTGESGTGKEVTAEALHAASSRNRGAFVAINCGAIPENLLESELFGHVKGAFTGAVENRIGAAKAADGGTLFLDEICEMDLKLQVKLLRFLQTGMIQRVGSSSAEPVDVRIVCATNRDPMREVAEGRFREDLLYRLNVIPIHLPALRERGDDILLLADRLTATIGKEEGRPDVQLSASSRSRILGHSWPGNVRELQNALRRAVVTAADSQIEIAIANPRTAAATLEVGPEPWASSAPARPEPTAPNAQSTGEPSLEGMTLAEIERMAIEAAIRRTNGNITKAAKNLGVNPSTIYRKLEKWAAQADDPGFAYP